MQNIIYNVGSNSYIRKDGVCILKFTINSFTACSVSVGLYAKQKWRKNGTYYDLLCMWANTELLIYLFSIPE